jgi:L-fucose isomerase-like protein
MNEIDFEKTIHYMLSINKDGVVQCDIWKTLNMDRRKCASILAKFEKKGEITKTKTVCRGAPSYIIKLVTKKEKDYSALLSGGIFSPCAGCLTNDDCAPETCVALSNWLLLS